MTDEQINRLVAERVMGYGPTEMRICGRDPETGTWEDVQCWTDDLGAPYWGAATEIKPCYNWLNTPSPIAKGWTPEGIAEADRRSYWHVVLDYCTDPAAWAGLYLHLTTQAMTQVSLVWTRKPGKEHTASVWWKHKMVIIEDALPGRALALAALRAYGVEG